MQQSYYNLKEEYRLSEMDGIAIQSELDEEKRTQLLTGALFCADDNIFYLWTWFPIKDMYSSQFKNGVLISPYPLSFFSKKVSECTG